MSEEVELAVGSIEAALTVFVRESGALGPIRELSDWVSSFIHYRRQAALAKVVNEAAERVRELGLPIAAVQDKLLREVLEGGSMEDDNDMRTRWANLLANSVTAGGVSVRRAFPGILSELEPADALLLDELAETLRTRDPPILDVRQATIAQRTSLDNLVRLELMRYAGDTPTFANGKRDPDAKSSEVTLTAFGLAFLQACRKPQGEDASGAR
jgi:hypothetical protein